MSDKVVLDQIAGTLHAVIPLEVVQVDVAQEHRLTPTFAIT